jgi:hypothetical protein
MLIKDGSFGEVILNGPLVVLHCLVTHFILGSLSKKHVDKEWVVG